MLLEQEEQQTSEDLTFVIIRSSTEQRLDVLSSLISLEYLLVYKKLCHSSSARSLQSLA
jgi:hypothetical protein